MYTLHSACAWEREMPGDLESGGRDVCMLERQSDRDLYWGLDFRREGVLMCSCVGVWGDRTTSLCVWGRRGVGGGRRGGVGFR